jgi:hypothetical protein
MGSVNAFASDGMLPSQGSLTPGSWPLPPTFGRFTNALLVANFGDAASMHSRRASFWGSPKDQHGTPIDIEGLWTLTFVEESSRLPLCRRDSGRGP